MHPTPRRYRPRRRPSHFAALGLVLAAVIAPAASGAPPRARANAPVAFQHNTDAAANLARQQRKPLFIYVPGERSDRWERERREDSQHSALQDAEVVQLVRDQFVALRVQRSTQNEKFLEQVGLGKNARLTGVISTPDGKLLERVRGNELSSPTALLENLTKALKSYLDRVYADEIGPALRDLEADKARLLDAFAFVRSKRMTAADGDVIAALGRFDDVPFRRAAYETLVVLATPSAVSALLDRAVSDRDAATALAACPLSACGTLADALNESFDARHNRAYDALCKILSDRSHKSPRFWQNADLADKQAETQRIRQRARQAAGQ